MLGTNGATPQNADLTLASSSDVGTQVERLAINIRRGLKVGGYLHEGSRVRVTCGVEIHRVRGAPHGSPDPHRRHGGARPNTGPQHLVGLVLVGSEAPSNRRAPSGDQNEGRLRPRRAAPPPSSPRRARLCVPEEKEQPKAVTWRTSGLWLSVSRAGPVGGLRLLQLKSQTATKAEQEMLTRLLEIRSSCPERGREVLGVPHVLRLSPAPNPVG